MAKFLAWQVWRGLWDSAELTEFAVGHTHNVQYQRFSECARAIFQTPCIQTPEQVLDIIRGKVKPRCNRTLVCERLHAALDWRGFFDDVEVSMHGHTQTRNMKVQHVEACHVWRFLRRQDVQWDGAIETAWPRLEPHPHDVILVVTQYFDDASYCQDPVVFVPNANFERLSSGPSRQDARSQLSERQIKEFRATAEKVRVRPWCLEPVELLG